MERVKVLKKIRRSFILSYIIERLIIKDLLFLYIYLLYFFHFFLNFIDRSIFGIVKKKSYRCNDFRQKVCLAEIRIACSKLAWSIYYRIFVAWCGGAGCFSFCLVVRHPVSARVSERVVVGIIRNRVTNKCYIVVRNIHSRDAISTSIIVMFAIET